MTGSVLGQHDTADEHPAGPALNRRGFLAALTAVGVAGALAACGKDGATPASSSSSAAPAATGPDLSGADNAVRPQDDLFRHVNGKWLREYTIPADKTSYSTFGELDDRATENLRTVIEGLGNPAAGSEEWKLKKVYDSYLDTAAIDKAGLQPLQQVLADVDAAVTTEQLAVVSAQNERAGSVGLVGFSVYNDPQDPTRNKLNLGQQGITLPDREYYLDKSYAEIVTAYRQFLTKLAELAQFENPADSAGKVLDFETALAKAQWDQAKSRDATLTNNPYKLVDLDTLAPGFAWLPWIRALGVDPAKAADIIVAETSYFTDAAKLWATTDIATLRLYVKFNVLKANAKYLSTPFFNANFDFFGKTLSGQEEPVARWKSAVARVDETLGEALGKIYVQKYFPPSSKSAALDLVHNLIAAYKQSFTNLEWLQPQTRTAAIAKLEKITIKIGYPDKWRDYSGLQVGDSLVDNMRNAAEFSTDYEISKLSKPVDKTEWGMTPQTVNAYYSSGPNEIVFPAAILQAPFFDPQAEPAVNYGGIGAVIGHEIGHAFDDQGSKYDGDGKLVEWWTAADRKAFEGKTKVLIAQYDALVPEGITAHVNGANTVGENLADLGGVSIAVRAYKIQQQDPNADLHDLFFSYGRIWRSKYRKEALEQQVASDEHSPGEFRVDQVVKNIPDFYTTFAVKPGDKEYLAPADRVTIW